MQIEGGMRERRERGTEIRREIRREEENEGNHVFEKKMMSDTQCLSSVKSSNLCTNLFYSALKQISLPHIAFVCLF